ncbi:radical SAM protein [Candidatus Bathyarchaeota archaeon]|nr:radical SAM protein [Candidatus Bathyarchaeota archaeon]
MNGGRVMVVLNLLINNDCNLNCPYCYVNSVNASGDNGGAERIKVSDIDRIMKDLHQDDISAVHIFGGEPFLHPKLKEICRIFHDYTIPVNIATNATIVEPHIPWLHKQQVSISVNLFGNQDIVELLQYEYPINKVLYNTRIMVETGLDVTGIYPVFQARENAKKTAEFYFDTIKETHDQTGVDNYFLLYLSKLGRAKDNWKTIKTELYRPDNWLLFLKMLQMKLRKERVPFSIYAEPAFESSHIFFEVPPEAIQCDLLIRQNLVLDYNMDMYPCILVRALNEASRGIKYNGDINALINRFNDMQANFITDNAQVCRSCKQLMYCCPCVPYIQDSMKDYRCSSKDKQGTLMGCPLVTVKL